MSVRPGLVWIVIAISATVAAEATVEDEPWIITGPVVITEPSEIGHVILLGSGSLTARDLPEPGLRINGHVWALGDSSVRFERSVIQVMSVFHGQYSLVGAERSRIVVSDCDYRVPNGVQHALMAAEDAELVVEDTDFGDVQLISAHSSMMAASRLTGNFEVIVQDDSTMTLTDIPRVPDQGNIWVWVEFSVGSVAEYTPPMPGYIDSWSFPPAGSSGIDQAITVDRCQTLLWPMLVREASDVTLRDIGDDHWIVVGFHMPTDSSITDVYNDRHYDDLTLDLADRSFRMVNTTVDTWNFYPQATAHVAFRDSVVGEILSMGDSRVWMERTTVDGTGGFFGARDTSRIVATDCRFTCTIEASQQASIELHSSSAEPYPLDPTGAWTRFGAYDQGRLFADQTGVYTTPALDGQGLISVSYIHEPPMTPPGTGESVVLFGSVAQFSLDPDVARGSWTLHASRWGDGASALINRGTTYIEEDVLGTWSDADPSVDHRLQTVLVDGLGRTLVGNVVVPGRGDRVR
jgi:hypothetical protein